MAIRQQFMAGQLFTLYHLGAIGDLTDGQLLERFTAGKGQPAELAFGALVERHGPMVLRVCTNALRDPHDAQDAFQATFLVLLRKAPELWIHDSLGPWLHRVARRVADRVQMSARRRREYERKAAESRTTLGFEGCGPDEPAMVLHEEIDRLPERYRVPVVLCHLEGQSHELAAKTLRVPVGTLKSRLHRARDLLRGRLTRRGADLPAGLLTEARPSSGADGALSLPLFQSFVRAAAQSGMGRAGQSGLISARTIHVVDEVIKAMVLTKMKIGMLVVSVAVGLAAGAAGVFAQQGPGPGGGQPASQRRAGGANGPAQAAAPGSDPAPSYIRLSRKMIIERLESELSVAEIRLERTIQRVASPSDPEAVRARKTVEKLAGIMARIDTVLVEAVDEFPTSFDFSVTAADPGIHADRTVKARAGGPPTDDVNINHPGDVTRNKRPRSAPEQAPDPKQPDHPPQSPPYDEHSLAQAAERMERSRDLYKKGFTSKAHLDRDVQAYELLKARIEVDITRGAERVDWARRMLEKGYVSKATFDAEILKHYEALMARLAGGTGAMNDTLLERYELLERQMQERRAKPGRESTPNTDAQESDSESQASDGQKTGGTGSQSKDPSKPNGSSSSGKGQRSSSGSKNQKGGESSSSSEKRQPSTSGSKSQKSGESSSSSEKRQPSSSGSKSQNSGEGYSSSKKAQPFSSGSKSQNGNNSSKPSSSGGEDSGKSGLSRGVD